MRVRETPLWSQYNNKEVNPMKRADKPSKVTININIFSNITLDGKSIICILIAIISLTLVVSISDSNVRADIIRFLISMASEC